MNAALARALLLGLLPACAATPAPAAAPADDPGQTARPAPAAPSEAAAPPAPELAAAPALPPPPADEASVRPGVNAPYSKKPIDTFVERFEGEGREVRDHKADILRTVAATPGQVVADIGAGTGLFTFDLAAAVGPTGKVYAVDVTPAFVQHLRRRVADKHVDNVEVVTADPKDVKLPPASLDVAFMCEVYHHVEYPRTYMSSLAHALKPGGVLWVIDYRRDPEKSPAWERKHVRAGPDTVRAEIESVGLRFDGQFDVLERNYIMRFVRPAAP